MNSRLLRDLTVSFCVVAASACGGGSREGDVGIPDGPGPSVVVIGDSVAAGEGTRYGFDYSDTLDLWVGPESFDPDWNGEFQGCHQAGSAYGNRVTLALDGSLTKLACTGATYENGVLEPQIEDGRERRTAQFGDWEANTELNPAYDAAAPDLVLVSLGANDLQWTEILAACILGTALGNEVGDEIGEGGDLGDAVEVAIEENGGRLIDAIEELTFGSDDDEGDDESLLCTEENPGTAIRRFFLGGLSQVRENYAKLISDIQARGEAAGKVPQIVFTTYHDPFPAEGGRTGCADLLGLKRRQIRYLRSLLNELSQTIIDAAAANDGVEVVDIRSSMAGHEFCSDDPWTYGLSIQIFTPGNPAPFHPTPDGHERIAEMVSAALGTF